MAGEVVPGLYNISQDNGFVGSTEGIDHGNV